MQKTVEKMLHDYGTDLLVQQGEKQFTLRGFLRAVNTTSWQSIENVATPLGEISRGQYTYIGPADVALKEGDTLSLGEKTYLLRRVEAYYYQNAPLYTWGICVEKGVNDTWGSQS